VTTVLLVRHGLTALTGPVLAGWTPGVHLDERGRDQAAALGDRLRAVPLDAVVTSPLERCRETADAVLARREPAPPLHVDERVGEVRYGSWTGRELKELRREPLWAVIQGNPSAVVFPDGEGLAAMSARAVAAVRDWNARLGADATYALVSHADVIKAILADALGLHLDGYQRIVVDPCSLSVVRYGPRGAVVERTNDGGGSVASLAPRGRRSSRRGTGRREAR
jgi:probable phosphoglycerate mutase